jgi:pimeloyl-ACP methyl ester carboxylesterase
MSAEGGSKRRSRWRILAGAVAAIVAAAVLFDFFPETQRALRGELRAAIQEALPEASERAAGAFGLIPLSRVDGDPAEAADSHPSVVLISGLDDPGLAWRELTPVLLEMGLDVWELSYPNDQPIADSARFAYGQFAGLRPAGGEPIVIVAHSMGGLVARELLTGPDIAYAAAAGDGRVPVVTDLIMVATPHHGSEMARFRLLTEARELWVNSVDG